MVRLATRTHGSHSTSVGKQLLAIAITLLSLGVMFPSSTSAQDGAPEEQPSWFSSDTDEYTRLGYGIPDSEDVNLVFFCEDNVEGITISTMHEAVHAKDGTKLDIHLSTAQGKLIIPGLASSQEMDDRLSVMGVTTQASSLKNLLSAKGKLTINIENVTVDYPLNGISEHAAVLFANCSGQAAAAKPQSATTGATATATATATAEMIDASFDCDKATRTIEQFICSRPGLRWQDLALSRSYQAAYAKQQGDARKTLVADQRDWLRERDRRCIADRTFQELSNRSDTLGIRASSCLEQVYVTRRLQLQDIAVAPVVPMSIADLGVMPAARSTLDRALLPSQALWVHNGKGIAATQDEVPKRYWDIIPRMQGSANFIVWNDDQGRTSTLLMMRPRQNSADNRIVAWGSRALTNFLFDTTRSMLIYPSETGILIRDLATDSEWRVAGTSSEDLPYALSADFRQLAWTTHNQCGDEFLADQDPKAAIRLCVAKLPANSTPAIPVVSASDDPWVGQWNSSANSTLSASIRRGTAKPEFLVVNLVTGFPGCAGAVTAYGKSEGNKLEVASYDPNDPKAPVCNITLTLNASGGLYAEPYGDCHYYHGASCTFEGGMFRESNKVDP